ncbi:MAG: DUF3298 and DUF4163 domain-containing protein [Algibacter sp.]|uniref:DUF3298 and DUF4163 domain-containing protein n=1 Tax=Algibacter sp. TaxID=1872428 RepID=UPI00263118B3|nr:DUF3298 and DUF4163 domain-containing protein [Algibacter sp.]MDG1730820.1 DUF3298 and DUF4163 domain-containing protein [Algibacter sp.]MDG2177526.1 DUF3298 and DUF4163 domain-containing protein [Algibacter sp.]
MTHNKYLLSLCCFLVLFNCKKEQDTSFSDINMTIENNSIVAINIPEAGGNNMVASQINSDIQKTIISALHIGNPDEITSSSVEESITLFNAESEKFKTDFPELANSWEAQIDGEVMYQSPELISIAITSYTNTGGAHGSLNISFLNFNSETGERIQNRQLFNNLEAFKIVAERFFKRAVKDKSLLLDNKLFELPKNIGYSEDGLILLYNTYEIAPYSTGIIEFSIPFKDIRSYLIFNSL